jgi:F0F1-type ATP synthase assembly protein I
MQKAKQNSLVHFARNQAYRLILTQGAIVLVIAILFGVFSGHLMTLISVILGGLCNILPNLYFAFRFFANVQKSEPRQVLRSFYWEEFCKLALSIASLLLILCYVPNVTILALFAGFLGAHLGLWILPFQKKPNSFF